MKRKYVEILNKGEEKAETSTEKWRESRDSTRKVKRKVEISIEKRGESRDLSGKVRESREFKRSQKQSIEKVEISKKQPIFLFVLLGFWTGVYI